MALLKAILIGLAIVIAIPLILALFIKQDYSIKRSINISKPVSEVYAYLFKLRNHSQFVKWAMIDPSMKTDYVGTDGEVGFVYKWDSQNKQVGAGEQEIKAVKLDKRLDYELRFVRPFKGLAQAYFHLEPAGEGQTKIDWVFASRMPYPMNFMRVVFNMEKTLGADLEQSLQTLKTNMENQ